MGELEDKAVVAFDGGGEEVGEVVGVRPSAPRIAGTGPAAVDG